MIKYSKPAKDLQIGDKISLDFGYGAHSFDCIVKIRQINKETDLWGKPEITVNVRDVSQGEMNSSFEPNQLVDVHI